MAGQSPRCRATGRRGARPGRAVAGQQGRAGGAWPGAATAAQPVLGKAQLGARRRVAKNWPSRKRAVVLGRGAEVVVAAPAVGLAAPLMEFGERRAEAGLVAVGGDVEPFEGDEGDSGATQARTAGQRNRRAVRQGAEEPSASAARSKMGWS